MSHNIASKNPQKHACDCNTKDIKPSRLEVLMAKYRALIAQAEAIKKIFWDKIKMLDITIATDADIYAIFEQTPSEPSDGSSHLSELGDEDENA